jgi:hypothetical protein
MSDDGRCLACKLEGRQPKAESKKTPSTLDRASAAAYLGVSLDTLDRFVTDGDLATPTGITGHRLKISDLQKLQQTLRVRAEAWKRGERSSPRFR